MIGISTLPFAFLITSLVYFTVSINAKGKCSKYNEVIEDDSGRCIEIGTTCGTLMVMYEYKDGYGACDCDTIYGTPMVYWPQHRRCYRVYSQGPCRPGDWIVVDGNLGVPTCQRNQCQYPATPKDDSKPSFWFLKNERCYETETQGYCKKNERIMAEYVDGDPRNFGQCYDFQKSYGPPSYYSLPCQPGQKLTKNRRLCKREVRFSG